MAQLVFVGRRVVLMRCDGRRGDLRVGLEVSVHVFGDNQCSPHDLIVAREGADVFVVALGGGGGEFEGFGVAGVEEFGGGQDVGCGGDVSAAGGIELFGFHFSGGFADGG